jgi:hypothetical protein
MLAVASGAALLAACNMVTGADDIILKDDEAGDDDTTTSAGPGPSGPSGAQTGVTTGAGPAGAGGATAATTGSGDMVATTGAGGATTTSSGAGAGGTDCQWPAGPFGKSKGQTLPDGMSWQGYAPGAAMASTISVKDLFDCDGAKGIDAVMFETSQWG